MSTTHAVHGIVLYDKHEVAEILRVKVSWLERRAAARQIPFTMLGGAYRFTPDHLTEIIRLSEQGVTTGSSVAGTEQGKRRRREPICQSPDGFVPLRARPRRAA